MDLSQIKISTRVLIFSIVNFSQLDVHPLNKNVLKVIEFLNVNVPLPLPISHKMFCLYLKFLCY